MQSAVKLVVPLVLLSSAVASYHSSTKLRRDGVLNLYPFPRVGRASSNTWQVPVNDMFWEYEPVEKRQLYAFPRVGRGDFSLFREPLQREFQQVRSRRTDSPGMWFGPRLGRAFKSEEDDITIQNDNTDRSEPEQIESVEEREKRQTKLM